MNPISNASGKKTIRPEEDPSNETFATQKSSIAILGEAKRATYRHTALLGTAPKRVRVRHAVSRCCGAVPRLLFSVTWSSRARKRSGSSRAHCLTRSSAGWRNTSIALTPALLATTRRTPTIPRRSALGYSWRPSARLGAGKMTTIATASSWRPLGSVREPCSSTRWTRRRRTRARSSVSSWAGYRPAYCN